MTTQYFGLSIRLFIIFNSLEQFCIAGWSYDLKNQECATLFTLNDYSGYEKSISSGKTVTDLSNFNLKTRQHSFHEITRDSDTWNNQVSSILVQKDCRVKLCSNTHLEGNCVLLKTNTSTLDSLWKNVSSLECGCPDAHCSTQTCNNIILSESECGRAFFKPNCNTCNGKFLTIRKLEKQNASHAAGNVSSIIVKPGCSFQAFTDTGFKGEESTLVSEFLNTWNTTFQVRSYKCFCSTDSNLTTQIPRQHDHNYPPLISLPLTKWDNGRMSEKYPNHPGLSAAHISMRNGRSPRNAYILAIGLTKSGKSSTINLMFDRDITGNGSKTPAIQEYRIPVLVEELGCQNCELRIIDMPGFGGNMNNDWDASFLAGLQQYLKNHEELHNKIPNVVLVFAKFNDERLNGSSSAFVKTLRGIELFREKLFDSRISNAVTVLTHFMSQSKEIRRNPAVKINEFRDLIEEYTLFPKPFRIAVAENRPDESGLPMINGYYYLPNKMYYPLNIFEKMHEATGKRDPIGEAIIRNAFNRNTNDVNITSSFFNIEGEKFVNQTYYAEQLQLDHCFNISSTSVSERLKSAYDDRISADMKNRYPGSLQYVQRVLNLQRICLEEHVPRTTVFEVFKFLKNFRPNPLIYELLEKTFRVKVPEATFGVVTGQGYNIFATKTSLSSPFLKMENEPSEIVFKIPSSVTCRLVGEAVEIYNFYPTHQTYLRDRVSTLTANKMPEFKAELKGDTLPGFNTLEQTNAKIKTVSAIKEYRLFQMILNDNPALDPVFATELRNIPSFNRSDKDSVNKWQNFFRNYGTHVVKSVYGGGSIEVQFDINSTHEITQCNNLVRDYFKFLNDVHEHDARFNNFRSTVPYTLHLFGGDKTKHFSSFLNISIEVNTRNLNEFEESLAFQPEILKSSMELMPLTDVVRSQDPGSYDKLETAVNALYKNELTYKPMSKKTSCHEYGRCNPKNSRAAFEREIQYQHIETPKPRKPKSTGT